MKMSANGWRKKEPVEIPSEESSLIQSLLNVHLNDLGKSLTQICDEIRVSPTDFKNDYLNATCKALRIFQ